MSSASSAVQKLAQARAAAEAAAANAASAHAAVVAGAAAGAAAAAGAQQPPAAQPGADVGQLIAQLLAQHSAQAAAALQQQSLQAAAALAQQEAARLGAEAARAELAVQAAEALAQQRRAGAGPAPVFHGQARDIAVHQWLIALERWFETAHIAPTADAERIEVAAAALRGPAQTWWAAALAADAAAVALGTNPALSTWAAFTATARKHFLPQAPERWAMQQLEALIAAGIKDVTVYTNRFVELDMLTAADQLSRVMAYQRGLPEFYRGKCAERQHTTLAAAMESTLALWNARAAAQGSRPAARVSNAEDEEEHEQADAPASSSGSAVDLRFKKLEDGIAALTAMFLHDGSGRGRGGRSRGGRGGGRGGQSGREGQRGRSPSPGAGGRARTPGVSDEVATQRLADHLCIKCAEPGHFARDCTNALKPTN
jgi:hypothetical protein